MKYLTSYKSSEYLILYKKIKGLKPEMYLNFIQRCFNKIVHLTGTFNRRNYERVADVCFWNYVHE
jgi:hypothetical protein